MNLFATAALGIEESGLCSEGLNKSQSMNFLSAGTKKSGSYREVAVGGGSTVS